MVIDSRAAWVLHTEDIVSDGATSKNIGSVVLPRFLS